MGGGDRGCIAERDHNFGILFSFVAKDCEHLLLVQGCCDSTGFDGRRSRVGGCDDCVGLEAGRWWMVWSWIVVQPLVWVCLSRVVIAMHVVVAARESRR